MKRAVQKLGRAVLEGLVRLLWRSHPGGPIDARSLKKILVIRVDPRVGDVLLTTPLLRALKKGLPAARIDLLLAAGKEPLVRGLCGTLIPFRKKDFFQHPLRFWGVIRRLRREHYDAVVEAAHWHAFSFTSSWLAQAVRAPIRVGHDRSLAARFLTHAVPKDPKNIREVPSKLELLGPFGIPADGEALETTVDAGVDVSETLAAVRALCGEGRGFIAFNPGARKADRRWSPEGFGRLAKSLADSTGLVPLILWGPGEQPIAEAVTAASAGSAKLAPPTDLAGLAACFRHSALVITNDTGPMHLAVATAQRVLAVLTFEDGPRWTPEAGPRFQGVRVDGVNDLSPQAFDRLLAAASELLAPPSEGQGLR